MLLVYYYVIIIVYYYIIIMYKIVVGFVIELILLNTFDMPITFRLKNILLKRRIKLKSLCKYV